MAGGVDDVNDQIGAIFAHPLAMDSRILGEDGDALFLLQIPRVHDPVDDLVMIAEHA